MEQAPGQLLHLFSQSRMNKLHFIFQTTATTILGPETSDSNVNSDSPMNNNKERIRARIRKRTFRQDGSDGGKGDNHGKEDYEDDASRPAKYIRLVDRKLTRVSVSNLNI